MPSSASPWPDTAIILAGGPGARLGSITANTPKPLLPVAGRPFLLHVLDHLISQRIKQVILATGYLAGDFERSLGSQYRNLSIRYSREDRPLGTGGALARAAGQCEGTAVWVLNGDTFFPADYGPLVAAQNGVKASLTLALRQVPDVERFGGVELDGTEVLALHEKGRRGPGLINAGLYLVSPSALTAEAPGGAFSLERDLLPRWISRRAVAAVVADAYFVDIGVPEDLERARRDLAGR